MSNNQSKPSAGDQSRRAFIRTTATAAAAVASTNLLRTPVYGQSSPIRKVLGANDRIVVGYIGVGGQGMAHVKQMKTHASANNIAQVAVCDVWEKRRNSSKAFIEKDSSNGQVEMFSDHRKLLERKDIDAVVIATHDTWHTKIAVDFLHREIPRHGRSARTDDWIKVNVRRALEDIFGEQLAVNLDTQLAVQLRDFNALVVGGAKRARNQQYSRSPEQSIGHT